MTDVGVEVVDAGELVEYRSANLFGTDDPAVVVARAAAHADVLADVIRRRELFKRIAGKDYVLVEGWTLLGSMLGVFPVLDDVQPVDVDGVKGWRATVTAQTRSGDVVGRATALCLRSEKRWAQADEYAVCSMAQTRATSKCLRAPLGFIVQLAGFSPTPEAEMPAEADEGPAGVSSSQHAMHNAMLGQLERQQPRDPDEPSWTDLAREFIRTRYGKTSRSLLTAEEMSALIRWTQWALDDQIVPPFTRERTAGVPWRDDYEGGR